MNKLKFTLTVVTIIFLLQNILIAQPVSQLVVTGTDYRTFGSSVACARDLNGDGYDDIVIGAEGLSGYEEYKIDLAQVFFGGIIPHNNPDLRLTGQPNELSRSVSAAGDVNGDGYLDLIVGGERAYIFFGGSQMDSIPDVTLNGDGGADYFGISVSGAGDVNNDGYDDVLVGAYNYQNRNGRASLFYGGANMDNTRDAVFEADSNHKQFGWRVLGIGDMNNDSFDDFLISATAGATIGRVYLYYGGNTQDNIADKIFTDEGQGGNFGISLATSDINGDNKSDLVISTVQNHGGFHVFYGSIDIDTISDVFVGNTISVYEDFGRSISTDDFNNDGFGDVIIGAWGNNSNRGKVHVYFGGVTMDNTPDIIYTGENAGDKFGFSVSTAGNFNGDGKPGFIIGAPDFNYQSGRVYLYQNSLITSVNPDQNEINISKSSDISVSFGVDMNASSINSSNIKVFGLQTGLKSSSVSYNAGTRTATINPNTDFKAGEKIQVTLSSGIQTSSNTPINPFTWTFTVQALGGTGVFTETIIDTAGSGTVGGMDILSGDFNGDNKNDIAAINYGGDTYIYTNNGNAGFSVTQIISVSGLSVGGGLTSGDFDSDGDLDLFMSFYDPTEHFYVYMNDGNGHFTQTSSGTPGIYYCETADLDNDGDLDVVGMWYGIELRYLINDGAGNFTPHSIPNIDFRRDICDVDNDGDLDLICANGIIGTATGITVLKNDGNANFTAGSSSSSSSTVWYTSAQDFDSDGDIDIVSSDQVFINDGTGSFSSTTSPGNGFTVVSGDFDGDGDIDNAYSENLTDDIKILKNNGSAVFSSSQIVPVGNSPGWSTSCDFDGDGDIDIAVGNYLGHSGQSDISVLLNDYSCAHIPYSISGNFAIPVATSGNVFTSSGSNGFWDIRNFGNTRATIPQNSTNDTVIVTAGDSLGFFVLYYIAYHNCGGDTLLSKHVYIEDPSSPMDFSIKAIPEGFLNTTANKLNSIDTFNVYLRNRAAPYALVDSAKGVIDIDSFTIQSSFLNAPTGLYFIVLKHRNTIETWSNSFGVVFVRGNDNSYDFTTSKFQAYANNLVLKGGRYCLYSGDVGQDGFIDASDLSQVENAVGAGASGYISTDINGDNYSDAEDISIVENNLSKSLKSPLNGDFFNTPEPEDQVIENTANFKNEKIEVDKASKVNEYTLSDNYPNPFNPTTKISYEIPNSNLVSLKVFDMLGKEVTTLINEKQNAGKYTVEFNAGNLPSGAYFYKIVSGDFVKVKKMVLVK